MQQQLRTIVCRHIGLFGFTVLCFIVAVAYTMQHPQSHLLHGFVSFALAVTLLGAKWTYPAIPAVEVLLAWLGLAALAILTEQIPDWGGFPLGPALGHLALPPACVYLVGRRWGNRGYMPEDANKFD